LDIYVRPKLQLKLSFIFTIFGFLLVSSNCDFYFCW